MSSRSPASPVGRSLPGLAALGRCPRAWLGAALVAGVTLGCVMVPVGLAYGDLAGVPPVAGLYAGILPLVAYALVGSSRQLVIRPDASTAALVGALVAPLAAGDLARHALLAAAFAVLVGVACLIAGAARIGFMADFLPKQVLVGFTGGLGLTIVAGQLGKLTGIPVTATDPLQVSADRGSLLHPTKGKEQ